MFLILVHLVKPLSIHFLALQEEDFSQLLNYTLHQILVPAALEKY